MGLLERLRQADVPEETLEEKTAHDALEKIEDRVSVDVIYKQAGSSHMVLSEINNQGSRAIESVSLDLVFFDSEDIEIQRIHFESERIPAHKSVAGDELEMIVNGESVWDNYTIEIILTYDYYGGSIYEKNSMEVGEWTLELFTMRPPLQIL